MGQLWLRNPGATEQYGPITLAKLRALAAAGLLMESTLAHDGSCEWRVLVQWPELMVAMDEPSAESWEGAPDRVRLNRGSREFEVASVPERPSLEGKSSLRLGRAVSSRAVSLPKQNGGAA